MSRRKSRRARIHFCRAKQFPFATGTSLFADCYRQVRNALFGQFGNNFTGRRINQYNAVIYYDIFIGLDCRHLYHDRLRHRMELHAFRYARADTVLNCWRRRVHALAHDRAVDRLPLNRRELHRLTDDHRGLRAGRTRTDKQSGPDNGMAKMCHKFLLSLRNKLENAEGFLRAIPARSSPVPLQRKGGTYVVPVLINKAITLDFVVDGGAADVSIPADVVMTLVRTGTLRESDFIGTQTYKLADGSTVPSTTFRIRSLTTNKIEIENVRASIAPPWANVAFIQGAVGHVRN